MNDNLGGECSESRSVATNSLRVSRRDFLGGALATPSLVLAGLPLQACAAPGDRTPAGSRVRERLARGIVNVQVSYDGRGRGHSEPSLAVNPRNPRNLLAVSMWGPDTFVSFDGGRTWQSGGALRLPPGSGGGNVSAAFDSAGHGFVCGSFGSPAGLNSVLMWRTADGGRTFTPPVTLRQAANLDRPWLATDHHVPGVVHVAWSEGTSAGLAAGLTTALRYARSADGGRTFEPPRTIASNSAGLGNPMVACGHPGTVYILYSAGRGQVGNAPPDSPSTVAVVYSHNRGQTFHPPLALGRSTIYLSFPGHSGTGSALPAIAAHPESGVISAAFVDHKPQVGHAGVVLVASRNGGRTWSRVTAVTPQHQVISFQPEVAIDDDGRIGVMAFAMDQGMVSVMLTISEPRSLRFGAPITVTDQPFDPAKVNYQLGDYQALATTPGGFHPLWNDTRSGQLELFTAVVPVGA